jgi:hypothetical protein
MKKKDLTPKQMASVPCPTCGVPTGEPCVLHSGGPRMEPHTDRKLSAAEAWVGGLVRGHGQRGLHVTEHGLFQLRVHFVGDAHNVEEHGVEIHTAQITLQGIKNAHL